jgi:hypothetical protein
MNGGIATWILETALAVCYWFTAWYIHRSRIALSFPALSPSFFKLARPTSPCPFGISRYGFHQPLIICRIFCRAKSTVSIEVISEQRYAFETRLRD